MEINKLTETRRLRTAINQLGRDLKTIEAHLDGMAETEMLSGLDELAIKTACELEKTAKRCRQVASGQSIYLSGEMPVIATITNPNMVKPI
ncbi:MAG: hypothetical protein WCT03_17220 [Candidatus Obscuribacterales bacterium]|jgi:hypothetical protein